MSVLPTADLESPAAAAAADADLVRRFKAGDESAWEALLARHSDLLQRQASRLAREVAGSTREDGVDETSEIYLFLAEMVQRSLRGFADRCRVRTWIGAVVGNRAHVLKSWLLRKDPARADVRLPVVLRDRPAVEHEIFRHLVWGLDPRRAALQLGVPESRCYQVEELLARHSPRVAARIRANRMASAAPVRLAAEEDGHEDLQLADPGQDPQQQLESDQLMAFVDEEVDEVLRTLERAERRLLHLLYHRGLSVSEIARLAAADEAGMDGLGDSNRCYYLKDRALQRIGDRIVERLRSAGHQPRPTERRHVLRCVEDLLRERGVPMDPPGEAA